MSGLLPTPNGDTPPAPAPDPSDDTPPAATRPDWVPETAWDADTNSLKLDELGTHVASIGKDADVPAEVAAYTPPAVEGVPAEVITGDPVYQAMAKVAHQRGIGQAAFAGLVKEHIEQTIAAEEASATAEKAKLGDKADERLQVVSNWLGSKLSADEVASVRHLTVTAAGVQALEKLMNGQVGTAPRTPSPAPAPAKSKADIEALMQKPEYYDPNKRNPAIVKEVNDWFAANAAPKK